MDQKQIKDLKKTTTKNVFFLTLRNLSLRLISSVGFFILTLILGAGEVGLFAIVNDSISILGYFSDVGLASALIQQKNKITKKQLQTTFFIQQSLVFVGIIIVLIIYPQIANQKGFGPKETWILISLIFSFVAASLKTIPSVLLERDLNFKAISTIDLTENITFYIVAVLFASLGFSGYSYAIAAFTRSSLGLILIYRQKKWPIGLHFNKRAAKKLFSFGIPFQLNSFIAMAKDRLSGLVVAYIISRESYGILSWAQKGPVLALSLMDAVIKVTFPTFSRLQSHHKILSRSVQRSIYIIAFSVFPLLAGICLLAPDMINLIPKYNKWLPAIFPLYFYSASYAIASITTPLTNAFNAIGQIKITTRFMIMWTVLTWILYPSLSAKFGYQGTAIAALLVGLSSFAVWITANKMFKINLVSIITKPLLASLLMILTLVSINQIYFPWLIVKIIVKITVGVIVYSVFHLIFSKSEIKWIQSQIKCLIAKK